MAIYPVKSCAGVAVQRWKLGKRGLIDDRHWMVVDSAGRFVSQREQPRLALVQPAYSDDFQTLILSSPACATPLRIDRKAPASGAKVTVTLWDDELSAREESAACHAWFAAAIGVPGVRLVRIAPEHRRTLDARHAAAPTADGAIAFPDSAPFLVISRQSLAELERQLPENRKRCADLRRFRPNIVVDGAHAPARGGRVVQNRHRRRQRRRARRAPRRQAVHALPPHHVRSRRRHNGRRRRRAALHAAPLPRTGDRGRRPLARARIRPSFSPRLAKGRWQNDWRRRRRCAARNSNARDACSAETRQRQVIARFAIRHWTLHKCLCNVLSFVEFALSWWFLRK
jgi:uncharacterized protein YcbX